MKIRQTHILIGLIVVLVCATLLLLSFIRARGVADEVTLPLQDEWYYYDTLFTPWHPAGGGPAWSVRYDAIHRMVIGPICVDVGLFGNVQRTNPPELREQITKQEEAASNQALHGSTESRASASSSAP